MTQTESKPQSPNESSLESHFERRLSAYFKTLVNHPLRWVSGWVLMMSVLIYSSFIYTNHFKDLPFNNSSYAYFNEANPDFIALRKIDNTYAKDTSVILIVAPKQGDIFTNKGLTVIEELTELAWTMPYVLRVDSISNFQHSIINDDDLISDNLYKNAASLSPEKIQQIRTIALNEKSLRRQTLSVSGEVATVHASMLLDENQTQAPEMIVNANQLLRDMREKYPDFKFMIAGDVSFADAGQIATLESVTQTVPVAMTFVLIFLFILLRNAYSVIITQLIIGLSIAFGYSLFILLGYSITPMSALASPIILTLAVADCVHVLVSYQQQCGLGKNKQDAMLESMRINFSPVWLTSITTAMGFLMLNFAASPSYNEMGTAVFLGVMMAFLFSISFLPAVMMLFPRPSYKFGNSQKIYMTKLGYFVIKNSRKLLILMSLIVAVLIALIPLNRVDDVFEEYFDDSFEARRALDFFRANMGGLQRLQFSIPAKNSNGIMEPEYLQNVENFARWAEAQPGVSHVRTFTDVVKRLNRNMHAGDESYHSIPNDRQLISQYVLLYELGLPFGLGLDNQMDIDKSSTKFEIVLLAAKSQQITDMKHASDLWIKNNWPDYMQTKATGLDPLFARISYTNVKSMVFGTLMALGAVSILLVFILGSVRYGALSLIPNILPAAMAFGVWGIIDGKVGLTMSVVGCMTLGIIVDDTVHFLSKYVRAKKELGLNTEDAALYAFETVGVALIATSVILVANFGIMGFSNFDPNSTTGIMASMTITIALIVDFFLFVPLLLVLDKNKE